MHLILIFFFFFYPIHLQEAVDLTAARTKALSPVAAAVKLRSGATGLQVSAHWLPRVSEASVAPSATAAPTPTR